MQTETHTAIAQLRTGDQITFGDRKRPLEITSFNYEVKQDCLNSFTLLVEGVRGGRYKLRQSGTRHNTNEVRVSRYDDGLCTDDWQPNGRVDIESIELVEKGDYEHDQYDQKLLAYDIGDTVYLGLDDREVEGVVDRFKISNRGVNLWILDTDQNPDTNHRKSYAVSPPDIIHDSAHCRYHPDEFQADIVTYEQVEISDEPINQDTQDPDPDPDQDADESDTVVMADGGTTTDDQDDQQGSEMACERHDLSTLPSGYDRCPRCKMEDRVKGEQRHRITRDPLVEPW